MLDPGTLIGGRYTVERLVGRGGMADVVRADDAVTGDAVAIKALRQHDRRSLARFRTEVDVLRRLDHPAVVRLRAWGAHDDQPYLVLDLVDGPTLAALLGDGPIDEAATVATGARLAGALAYAHRLGVVHRDVKPSNVLLDGDGARPRLADFGIARLAGDTGRTTTGSRLGTPAYVAPEQLEGHVGPEADVYALGLVLIECLTGETCFTGSMAEAAMARLHRPPDVPAELPGWLRHTLQAMTARAAEQRPPVEAVAAALRECSVDPLLDVVRPLPRGAATGTPRPHRASRSSATTPRPATAPRPATVAKTAPRPATGSQATTTLRRLPSRERLPLSAAVALAAAGLAVLTMAGMLAVVALSGG